MINYRDSSLIITYIQIYLKEYFGLTVKQYSRYQYDKIRKRRYVQTGYEMTSNDPIKVTGYLTPQTYSSIALYIALNYPNEGFPYLWTKDTDNDSWVSSRVYNNLFPDPNNPDRLIHLTYEKYNKQTEEFETYEVEVPEHLKYYNETTARNERRPKYVEFNTRVSTPEEEKKLIDLISYNMNNTIANPYSISIPDRIISYILKEVVTPSSSAEEILRVKKMFYDYVSPLDSPLGYDPSLFSEVVNRQINFRNKYTDNEGNQTYPDQFKDFYVTGYMDPWTEIVSKGGIEIE